MLAARLAALYAASPTVPSQSEIWALENWIMIEYSKIPCRVQYVNYDLDLPTTVKQYEKLGALFISVAHNTHPYLCPWINARFRAVHDWHHIQSGADSTLRGEIATFNVAKRTAPRTIWWLLFSEIALQAAACIYHGSFQLQKTVRAGGF
jgi:hypothetical protein